NRYRTISTRAVPVSPSATVSSPEMSRSAVPFFPGRFVCNDFDTAPDRRFFATRSRFGGIEHFAHFCGELLNAEGLGQECRRHLHDLVLEDRLLGVAGHQQNFGLRAIDA